jgi:hypothetical protein
MRKTNFLMIIFIAIPLISRAQSACPQGAGSLRNLSADDGRIHNIECYDPSLHSVTWSTDGTFHNTKQVTGNIHALVNGIDPTGLIYGTTSGCCSNMDAVGGGIKIPDGATVTNGNGIAGYVDSQCDSKGGNHCNGVGGFFFARASTNGAGVWGLNPVVGDSAPSISDHYITGMEIDMGGYGKPKQFRGIALLGTVGSSFTMPASAIAFTLFAPGRIGGGNAPWPVGIAIAQHATSAFGMQLYPSCTLGRDPCRSQSINYTAQKSGGGYQQVTTSSDENGNFAIAPAAGGGVAISGKGGIATIQTFNGPPSGPCANTTVGINAAARSSSTVLYVCLAGTAIWRPVAGP